MIEEKEFIGTIRSGRILGDTVPDKDGNIHRLFIRGEFDVYIGNKTGKAYLYGIGKNPDVIKADRLGEVEE